MDLSQKERESQQKRRFTEDWVAVGLAAAVIVAVVCGWRPALPKFGWKSSTELATVVLSPANLLNLLLLGGIFFGVAAAGIAAIGGHLGRFVRGFPVVFLLACVAQLAAGEARVKELGLEYVIFALLIGLVINHLLGLPEWLREAVRTEFYIKTGLVILGAGILFREILQAGWLGLAQACLVVAVVWYFAFWLSKRLRVDEEFGAMMATAVSICGVSAAIAACGAINGDRRKLSYVTSLVLIVALPMMIVMPWIVEALHIPELVAGAWLGGTLDTSGSVVAAGEAIGPRAMKTGVIVKFSQNVLIGFAAFALSIWWTMRKADASMEKPTAGLIWERFPKFVLGFVAASLVFSFLLPTELVKSTEKLLAGLRTYWFALAFVSIGLETRVTELLGQEGRPATTFVVAQAFNVLWTLLLAWLLFGGLIFPAPDIQ